MIRIVNFILALLSKKNKLKATSLYQVLIGKRTSSTLSYAYFNDLLPYLGSLPNLELAKWEKIVHQMESDHLLEMDSKGFLSSSVQESPLNLTDFSSLNCYRYGKMTQLGWRLVQFFIQVISEHDDMNQRSFLEVTPFYVETVQKLLQGSDKKELKKEVKKELIAFFSQIDENQATNLARSFSGGDYVGKAFYQIYEEENECKKELMMMTGIHAFFQYFLIKKESLFYLLLKNLYHWNLNQSLLVTRKLFLEGRSLSEISQIRALKESTIRDHVIEWAILDETFPFDWFQTGELDSYFQMIKLPAWETSFKEVNQRQSIDFLTFRLYQIERKRKKND